mgnify:CR=1 FL=1
MELNTPTPYAYAALVLFFGLLTLRKTGQIGKHVAISASFTKFISAAVVLIMLSTLPDIFYELFEMKFPLYQVIYVSHFFFYASLSLIFLSFGRVKISGGIYDAAKKISSDFPRI